MRRLFRACVRQHVLYKLADDSLHFYPELLAPLYFSHPAFYPFFLPEVAPAFDILEQTHLLKHRDGEYLRSYELTQRGIDLGRNEANLLGYVEHSLKMNQYWGDVLPGPG